MFNDYAKNMSRNIHDSKQEGTGRKILAPRQMLQRLPISLAQINAGNNSQIILSIFLKNIVKVLMTHQSKSL